MAVVIRPHAGGVGAEILGLDLNEPVPPETARDLRRAFERHHVLVMRERPLTEAQQVAFAACFGTVELAREKSLVAERNETMIISNVRVGDVAVGRLPEGEVEWHFDKMYYPEPNMAAVLHAVEIPDRGGETLFSDTSLIYDALPPATRQHLAGLHVTSSYDYEATKPEERRYNAAAPSSAHPLVRWLPDGRKSLFAAPLMVDGIVELAQPESAATLAEIYAYFGRPEFTYEHRWRVGDTLIWDNRCCAHKRNDFDPAQRRLLRRVSIADPAFSKSPSGEGGNVATA